MQQPEECPHESPWLEGSEDGGWRFRCVDCWTLGPQRSTRKAALQALKEQVLPQEAPKTV